jgi:hypothetical protein
LSSYSTQVYNYYFNEYPPYSTIAEFGHSKTDIASLGSIADSTKADYIICFTNVHTELRDGLPVLKLTTILYSRKDNNILLAKETEGDLDSRGDMWTCGGTKLSCLFINGVRTSSDEVGPIIAKRQMRK